MTAAQRHSVHCCLFEVQQFATLHFVTTSPLRPKTVLHECRSWHGCLGRVLRVLRLRLRTNKVELQLGVLRAQKWMYGILAVGLSAAPFWRDFRCDATPRVHVRTSGTRASQCLYQVASCTTFKSRAASLDKMSSFVIFQQKDGACGFRTWEQWYRLDMGFRSACL